MAANNGRRHESVSQFPSLDQNGVPVMSAGVAAAADGGAAASKRQHGKVRVIDNS